MFKIKKEHRIHIICGALTLLSVLFIYFFFDDSVGSMQHMGRGITPEKITQSQIDDNYRLAKEIPLNDDLLIGYLPYSGRHLLYETKSDNISTDEMIVFVENATSPIMLTIESDEYLSKNGKAYYHDQVVMYECVGGECIRFDTENDVNYSVYYDFQITTSEMDIIDEAPDTLAGTVKIYERIGGNDNE